MLFNFANLNRVRNFVDLQYYRDGSGLKRNWLKSAASVNMVGGGGNLGHVTGPVKGLWGNGQYGGPGGRAPGSCCNLHI